VTKINEINIELSGNSQRYVNECCESEFDGKIDGFGAGCCKCRGGVAVAVWLIVEALISILEAAFGDPDQVGTTSAELDKLTQGNKEFSQYYVEF
jgi:predicted PP-loop superfamily ATPase